jgi:hypothetical protein
MPPVIAVKSAADRVAWKPRSNSSGRAVIDAGEHRRATETSVIRPQWSGKNVHNWPAEVEGPAVRSRRSPVVYRWGVPPLNPPCGRVGTPFTGVGYAYGM